MKPTLIDLEAAWEIIEKQTPVLSSESVWLEDALGRVLAQDILADRDYPAFDRSAMDGFAVRSVDVESASTEVPVRLRIVGEATPGNAFVGAGGKGSAVRIMTGARCRRRGIAWCPSNRRRGSTPRPNSFRSCVRFGAGSTSRVALPRGRWVRESTAPGSVSTQQPLESWRWWGRGGSRLRDGQASACWRRETSWSSTWTYQGRRAYAIPTARCSRALARPHCGDVRILAPAVDRRPDLDALISQGLAADLLLVTGGVSMGAYDLVGAALLDAGVRVHFERVALQPGKPVTFGTHDTGIVLALPGNPVSAFTTFRLFARLALSCLQGQTSVRPLWSLAPAVFEWQRRNSKWLLLPGKLSTEPLAVERVRYTGSGDLMAFATANCQIVLPPKQQRVSPGEPVAIWRI